MMENLESNKTEIIPGAHLPEAQGKTGGNQPNIEQRILTYRFGNLQGIGARDNQEDSFTFSNVFDENEISEKGALAVVADGMGGLRDGKLASETAVSVIRQDFMALDIAGNISKQLNAIVRHAGEKVEQAVQGKGGCTVIAAVIYHDKLYYSSLGDSYFYLKRGEYLTRLNRFHNVLTDGLAELVEDGEMNPEDVLINDKPQALTEFLGKNPIKSIDCFARPLKLRYGDVLLLCSDGVGGTLKEQAVFDALCRETPAEMCAVIDEEIKSSQRRYQDNYTALVIQCVYPEQTGAEL